jgi:uncharacterized alpha-E superfamily protein
MTHTDPRTAMLMPMRRHSILSVPALMVVLALSGCADEEKPAVCDSLDAVRTSASNVREANVSENGLSHVSSSLGQLRQSLQQLGTEARTQFDMQITAVRTAADQLSSSVTAAKADPNAATLGVVRDALAGLGNAVTSLGTAMADTC